MQVREGPFVCTEKNGGFLNECYTPNAPEGKAQGRSADSKQMQMNAQKGTRSERFSLRLPAIHLLP